MQHISKKYTLGMLAGAVVIAAVFFFIGRASAKPAMPTSPFGGQGGMMQNGGMRRNAGNNAMGTILSSDATSITLQTRGGGSKTILISSSTQVLKSAPGTRGDLANGTNVIVNGTPNADGSISASTVSIRPADPSPIEPKNP